MSSGGVPVGLITYEKSENDDAPYGTSTEANATVVEGKETKRALSVAMFVNFLVWLFMVSIVMYSKDRVKYFNYPMTIRYRVEPNFTKIDEAFSKWTAVNVPGASNFPFDVKHRGLLRDQILMAAACMPVASAGGTYVWGPQAVSPMCDCLDGAIASKMLAYVGNNATFLSDLEAMTATDLARSATSKTVADDLARIQWSKCLDVARPTQVEEFLLDTGGYWSTNIAYSTIIWCFASLMATIFLNSRLYGGPWWTYPLSLALLGVTLPSLWLPGAPWACAGIATAITIVITGIMFYLVMAHGSDETEDGETIRNVVMTSLCYAIGAWASWSIYCSSTQQRDYLFAMTTSCMVIVVGIMSSCVRYAFYTVTALDNERSGDAFVKYSDFFSNVWYSNLGIIASLFAIPGTNFVVGAFSNTNGVSLLSVAIMLSYPIIQKVHLAPRKRELNGSDKGRVLFNGGGLSPDTKLYVGIDILARFIIASAVGMDILATQRVDRS